MAAASPAKPAPMIARSQFEVGEGIETVYQEAKSIASTLSYPASGNAKRAPQFH
jgi:hypothetical protein